MLIRSPRANPPRVRPYSRASDTASEVGAPTPISTGAPATTAFCTSSNDSRPLTHSTQSASGSRPSCKRPADHLVHRVVATDVLADADELGAGVEQTGCVEAAGAFETGLHKPVRQGGEQPTAERSAAPSGRGRCRVNGDLLDRSLPADAARRGRVEAPARGSAQQRAGDVDRVGGEIVSERDRPPGIDQALAEEEAERQFLVVAGSSHRHRDGFAVDPDLQRLLDGDGVLLAVTSDQCDRARGLVTDRAGGLAHTVRL